MSRRLVPILGLACLLAGCGRSGIQARGRLVKNGDPFVPSDAEVVHIAFFSAGETDASRSYVVNFDRTDGTFRAAGRGMPPGKYRVTVSIIKNRKDELKGAFNAKNSPLLCEVASASEEITLDLATPSKPDTTARPVISVRKSRS